MVAIGQYTNLNKIITSTSIFELIMMNDNHQKYPRNQVYIENNQSDQPTSPKKNTIIKPIDGVNHSPSVMSASALSERVHYL